jgi:hypothetical protein
VVDCISPGGERKTERAAKMPEKAKELRDMLSARRAHVKAPMPARR